MIRSFKDKRLKWFYDSGKIKGIPAKHVKRLRMQLHILDTAKTIGDIDRPGFRLHPLKGNRKKIWSITV